MPNRSEYSAEELQSIVFCSVSMLMKRDELLLKFTAHEQAISHRLAFYLEPHFFNRNIDCEYDKHLDARKSIKLQDISSADLKKCSCGNCNKILRNEIDLLEPRALRPDILVHKRATDEYNTLVVEIKKLNNCPFDKQKLLALTTKNQDYKYTLGAFIYFPLKKPVITFFVSGKEIAMSV